MRLKIATDDSRLEDDLRDLEERTERQVEVIRNLFEEKKEKIRRGDELAPLIVEAARRSGITTPAAPATWGRCTAACCRPSWPTCSSVTSSARVVKPASASSGSCCACPSASSVRAKRPTHSSLPRSRIAGTVFNDANDNGAFDGGEIVTRQRHIDGAQGEGGMSAVGDDLGDEGGVAQRAVGNCRMASCACST